METREALLNKLEYVKSQISKILSVTEKQVNIVASFRETEAKIPTTGAKSTATIVVIVLAVVYMAFMALYHCWSNMMVMCVCAAFIYYKRNRKSKLKTFAYVLLVGSVGLFFLNLIGLILAGNFGVLLVTAFLVICTVLCIKAVIGARNAKIEKNNAKITEHNRVVQEQYDKTVEQLKALKSELYRNTGAWYPKDYYSLDAVNFFISAIENFKADSMKEAIRLFDDTQYKNKMLSSQQAIVDMNRQQVINQQEMVRQLRYANVLNVANLSLQWQNLSAVRANADAINRASSQAFDDRNRIVSAINNLRK